VAGLGAGGEPVAAVHDGGLPAEVSHALLRRLARPAAAVEANAGRLEHLESIQLISSGSNLRIKLKEGLIRVS
jgi:hypothetical protein